MTRRIALISEHASPLATLGGVDAGGQNVYVAHLARRLAARGDVVDVFTRRDAPHLPDVVELAPGARVVHVPAGPAAEVAKEELLPWMPTFADWMSWYVARQGVPYDVAHANFFMSGYVAAELRQRNRLPFVVTFHALGRVRRRFQGSQDRFADERFAIEERVVFEADRIIAECPQDELDLVTLYGADRRRISIVPCGFDPGEFRPGDPIAARRRLGLDPDERIVLQLGRLVPRKGVDNVIRAVAVLRRQSGVRARLLVVGGTSRTPDPARDPELARLVALAADEGVADAVMFVGRRDRAELADFYVAADVFVSTPWYEPFGITPLEAMACGTPVIGSDVGGIRFSVRHGETGFLVPPNDPGALASRLAVVLGDADLRARLSAAGIRRVNEHFTWERVATGVSAVYDDVVAGRRTTAPEVRTSPRAAIRERRRGPVPARPLAEVER
jgi:glycosyltransferase involved in cell wall biosynthesis